MHGADLLDAPTEEFIGALMARMSLEEKVGQVIQADISSITAADLRRYPLGAVLAGGDTAPLDRDTHAPAQSWLETTRALHAVAVQAARSRADSTADRHRCGARQ